jgi:hypothetical protein
VIFFFFLQPTTPPGPGVTPPGGGGGGERSAAQSALKENKQKAMCYFPHILQQEFPCKVSLSEGFRNFICGTPLSHTVHYEKLF